MLNDPLLSKVTHALGLTSPTTAANFPGILTAWSGGLDSTVLLHILHQLSKIHDFELFAIHIDHNLRPCSAQDAAWCRREAARLHIKIHVEELTIRTGNSTQNQARAQRYAALFNTAQNLQLPQIATAHHADDAIETALLNLARGTGLKGLTSLAADFSPPNSQNIRLIRPLLNCTRAELEQYAARHHLTWRNDPSNQTDHYDRNRIRHHVIPHLTHHANNTHQLHKSLEHLREDSNTLEQLAKNLFHQALHPQSAPQTIALDRNLLANAPPALITRVLAHAHTGWNRATLNTALAILSNLQKTTPKTQRISLTGATATFRPDQILIEPTTGRGPKELDQRTAFPAQLNITQNGEIPWFDTLISWQRKPWHPNPHENQPLPFDNPSTAYFDADQLPPTLTLRGPHGNERIQAEPPPTGRKRLKDLWNEHDIPTDLRWRWPCLTCTPPKNQPEEILWICNLRRAHHYKITDQTRTILIMSCLPTHISQ